MKAELWTLRRCSPMSMWRFVAAIVFFVLSGTLCIGCSRSLVSPPSYSCTEDGLKQVDRLESALNEIDRDQDAVATSDCDSSNGAGVQVYLAGDLREARLIFTQRYGCTEVDADEDSDAKLSCVIDGIPALVFLDTGPPNEIGAYAQPVDSSS